MKITKLIFFVLMCLTCSKLFADGKKGVPDFVDRFGVNIMSGSPVGQNLSLNIGTGQSGLQYSSNVNNIFSNNLTGTLNQVFLSSGGFVAPHYIVGLNAGTYYKVDVGSDSELFTLEAGGGFTNTRGTGGELSCVSNLCTYTNKFGELVKFDKNFVNGYSNIKYETNGNKVISDASKVHEERNIGLQVENIKPDGEIISNVYERQLTYWDPVKLSSISSSLGWMIKFSYTGISTTSTNENQIQYIRSNSTIKIKVVNTSEEYCNGSAVGYCNSLIKPWQSLEIKTDGSMSYSTTPVCGASCRGYISFILQTLPSVDTYIKDSSGNMKYIGTMGYVDPSANIVKADTLQSPQINSEEIFYSTTHEVTNAGGYTSKFNTHLTPCNKTDSTISESFTGLKKSYGIKSGFLVNNGSSGSQTVCTPNPGQGTVNQVAVLDYQTGNHKYFAYDTNMVSQNGAVISASINNPDGQYAVDGSQYGLSSFTDKLTRKWSYKYAPMGDYLDKLISPDGVTEDFDYVGSNLKLTKLISKNSADPNIESSIVYYSEIHGCNPANIKYCNKPYKTTDEKGVVTTYTYHAESGSVATLTKAAVNVNGSNVEAQVRYKYEQKYPYVRNSSGNLVANSPVWVLTEVSECMTQSLNYCVGTADEKRIIYSDFTNNLLSQKITIQDGTGTIRLETVTEYDIYGNVIAVDGPRVGTDDKVFYFYDLMRQKIGEIGVDPDGSGALPRQATRAAYNGDGQVISSESGIVWGTTKSDLDTMQVKLQSTIEYSTVHGLPTIERFYAAGILEKVTQKSYDNNLRLECVAQRLNRNAWSSLPASACTLGSAGIEGNDRITKYNYDATGAVLSTVSAYGTPLQRVDRTNTYSSVNGLLTTEADGKGNTTFYKYDNFNRLWKTVYPISTNGTVESTTDYIQTNYRSGSQLVDSVRLRDGLMINFSEYDPLGRVKTKSGALSESFTYNNFNQVVSHTNNTTGGVSQTSTYVFNSLGWLKSESRIAGGVSLGSVSYGHDNIGRRTSLTWPDNFSVNYDYNVNGVASEYLRKIIEPNGTLLAEFDYFDNGRRKSLRRGNGVITSYQYNDLQQLKSQATDVGGSNTADDISENFTYALSGQLKTHALGVSNSNYVYTPSSGVTTNYAPDALNRISSTNGNTFFCYDGRGNLIRDNCGQSSTYSTIYTYNANNLLLNAQIAGVTTTLSYDAENRLYSVQRSGATTKFMYDGTDLIAETNSSNSILRRYVHGPEIDDPIVWYEGSGTSDRRYYTANRQGSIVGVTTQSGLSTAVNSYDEYGNQKLNTIGRFQYTGQTWLPEVGLYYYKARLYSPSLGRFMQTDPIGYKDGMNWYAYVGNDPINATDPTGKSHHLDLSLSMQIGLEYNLEVATEYAAKKMPDNKAAQTARYMAIEYKKNMAKLEEIKAAGKSKNAEARAKQIHSVLDSRAQRARTTAVTETKEGINIVSSSERRLTPAQRAQLGKNEVEGVGDGHAEKTGINAAKEMGLTPTGTAASRPICSGCACFLCEENVAPLSPLKK